MGTSNPPDLTLSESAFRIAFADHIAKKLNRNAAGQLIAALPTSDIRTAHTAEWADWVDDYILALAQHASNVIAPDLTAPIAEYTFDFATLANETLADAQVDILNSIAWTVTVATGDDLAYVNGSGMVATITDTLTAHDGNSSTCTKIETTWANVFAALSLSSGLTIDVRNRFELVVRYASPPTAANNQIVGISDRGAAGTPTSTSGRMRAAGYEHDGTRQNATVFLDTTRDRYYPHDSHDVVCLSIGHAGATSAMFAIWDTDLDTTSFDGIMPGGPGPQTAEPVKLPENLVGVFFRGTSASSYAPVVRSITIRAYT